MSFVFVGYGILFCNAYHCPNMLLVLLSFQALYRYNVLLRSVDVKKKPKKNHKKHGLKKKCNFFGVL